MTIAEQFSSEWGMDNLTIFDATKHAIKRLEARIAALDEITKEVHEQGFQIAAAEGFIDEMMKRLDALEHPEQPKGDGWIRIGDPVWVCYETGLIEKASSHDIEFATHIRPYIPGEDKPGPPKEVK